MDRGEESSGGGAAADGCEPGCFRMNRPNRVLELEKLRKRLKEWLVV
jgi:hypothetical protein